MDATDLNPLVEDLSGNIDDLEESLAPLLNAALSASTSKLPLLDKAKLYVLTTYAIESLLFSYLRLNGVDAKNHAVFQELTRVKHYFDKLKTAETGPAVPTARLDKGAAGRFIKAGLAGNDAYDRQRKELQDRESAGAKRKFEDMGERVGKHIRFENTAKKLRSDDENDDQAERKGKVRGEEYIGKETQQEKQVGQEDKEEDEEEGEVDAHTENETVGGASNKKSKHKSSKSKSTEMPSHRKQKSNKAPKGAGEAFTALLNRPAASKQETKDTKTSSDQETKKTKKRKNRL